MMKTKAFAAALTTIAALVTSAHAADIPQSQTPADDEFKNCAFVTSDCETCIVDSQGMPSCSSTGIACMPKVKRCLIEKK